MGSGLLVTTYALHISVSWNNVCRYWFKGDCFCFLLKIFSVHWEISWTYLFIYYLVSLLFFLNGFSCLILSCSFYLVSCLLCCFWLGVKGFRYWCLLFVLIFYHFCRSNFKQILDMKIIIITHLHELFFLCLLHFLHIFI